MSVSLFKFYHGAVLTELVRKDRKTTVRLIETHPTDEWAVYEINRARLLIKHCASPNEKKKTKNIVVLQFR